MLVVETIAEIRRAFFKQGKPIKAICREMGVSRLISPVCYAPFARGIFRYIII
jgi:hypothetical protein